LQVAINAADVKALAFQVADDLFASPEFAAIKHHFVHGSVDEAIAARAGTEGAAWHGSGLPVKSRERLLACSERWRGAFLKVLMRAYGGK